MFNSWMQKWHAEVEDDDEIVAVATTAHYN